MQRLAHSRNRVRAVDLVSVATSQLNVAEPIPSLRLHVAGSRVSARGRYPVPLS
jgi:hypothetical protein